MAGTFDQRDFDVRCEWGERGLRALAPTSDAVVIVDVLSFSTSVEVAVGRGAVVYPFRFKDASAARYAEQVGAVLAGPRAGGGFSLSPASLLAIPPGTRLVLPSPNGAALSLEATALTFAGCLRNARAVARAAARVGRRISVVAAGERWEDGSLRPCAEDLIGAGAVVCHLPGERSPEAELAAAAFDAARGDLARRLASCGSGRELIEAGFARDVELAAGLDAGGAVPVLEGGAFVPGADAATIVGIQGAS